MSPSFQLSNEELTICINQFGAELAAITDTKTGINYLWNADETFWKRHSPILFPIVGTLKNKEYTYKNHTYSMSQHGFARDMEMILDRKSDTEVWYSLRANEETKVNFPFDFHLKVGYRLQGRTITVMWKVMNHGDDKMYFQIGAHPAFCCPLYPGEERSSYQLDFHTDEPISYSLITKNGVLARDSYTLDLENGLLPITNELFNKDALVLENPKTKRISLVDPNGRHYVTVTYDAPVVGVWSPAGKVAPFVCIEPWYGRCDAEDFTGALSDREWINTLAKNEQFTASYQIIIN